MAASPLDEHFPLPETITVQATHVAAPADATYAAIRTAPIGRGAIALGRVRALLDRDDRRPLPAVPTIGALLASGRPWVVLDERPGEHLALGLLLWDARWTDPGPSLARFAAPGPGAVRVGWSLSVSPAGPERSLLLTETRTEPADEGARRRFAAYWRAIAPFAALTRRLVLDAIRAEAERRGAASEIARLLPRFDARTVQHVAVAADAATTWQALWEANLVGTPLARGLSELALVPERIAARVRGEPGPPAGQRTWRLGDAFAPGSPWLRVAEDPGREVVLGLLWTPPAGGTTRDPAEFAGFDEPGFAKVAWSLRVTPAGDGRSRLTAETRTQATDAGARRRFKALWPLISPGAALLRRQMLEAVRRTAERGAMPLGPRAGVETTEPEPVR